MDDIQWTVFQYIVSQVETPLLTAVSQVMNAFLSYVGTPLKSALILYVAISGYGMIFGRGEAPGEFISRVFKMGLVVFVLTGAGIYQQYVYDFFFTILPRDLSNALTSSGAANIISANSFDVVWIKAWRAGLEVWRTLSWHDFAQELVVVVFWIAAIISTVFCFAIWLISRVVLALYIALGPLLIGLALFGPTRAIFERWIGSMISCVILQITTVVLLYIVLTVEQQVVGTVASMGSVDPMAMIQVLLAGVIFFAVSAFVAFQLPAMASSLSGGLHFHTGVVGRAVRGAIGSTGSTETDVQGNKTRVGRSGLLGLTHAGAEQAGAAGRQIYQRIRPSPGGSLSDAS